MSTVFSGQIRVSNQMRDELFILPALVGHPNKEAKILEMLSEAEGLRGGWQASPVAAQEEPMEAEADMLEEGEIQRGEVALETVEEASFAPSNLFPSNTQVVQQVSET